MSIPQPVRLKAWMWIVPGFFLLGLMIILRHEMWQDEWQAWLIAQESASLYDLLWNLRYEGHPGLWHFCLFLISRFTSNSWGMQCFHLLVATASIYVFCRYSPFPDLQKVLFSLGYFPVYEYAAISRNYALGVLGLFSFCALFCTPPPRKYFLLSLVLFFLCQTNVYGLMIAMVGGMILVYDALRKTTFTIAAAVFLIIILGIFLAVIQVIPPVDSGFAVGWNFKVNSSHFMRVLTTVWKSYVPIPAADYHFWGTNIISDLNGQFLLSLLILVFALLFFYGKPVPFLFYSLGTLAILSFTYVKYFGSLRHHGHLFIIFIAGLWLSFYYPDKKILTPVPGVSGFLQGFRSRFVTLLLAVQLLAGVVAISLDLSFPFSASREAADFIKHNQLDRMIIWGDADDAASSLAGCLGCWIYYPKSQRWGSFIIWDQNRNLDCRPDKLMRQMQEVILHNQQEVLLVLNYELENKMLISQDALYITLLKKFTHSLVPEEKFFLYRLRQRGGYYGGERSRQDKMRGK